MAAPSIEKVIADWTVIGRQSLLLLLSPRRSFHREESTEATIDHHEIHSSFLPCLVGINSTLPTRTPMAPLVPLPLPLPAAQAATPLRAMAMAQPPPTPTPG